MCDEKKMYLSFTVVGKNTKQEAKQKKKNKQKHLCINLELETVRGVK